MSLISSKRSCAKSMILLDSDFLRTEVAAIHRRLMFHDHRRMKCVSTWCLLVQKKPAGRILSVVIAGVKFAEFLLKATRLL